MSDLWVWEGRGLRRKDAKGAKGAKGAKEEGLVGGDCGNGFGLFLVTDLLILADCSDFFEGG